MEGSRLKEEAFGFFVELVDLVGGVTQVLLGLIGHFLLIIEIKIIFEI